MNGDRDGRALDLALQDAPPTGEPDMDAAVAKAQADIAAIRAGLEMLAVEAPPPATRGDGSRRKLGTRVVPMLAAAACVLAAVVVGGLLLGSNGSGVQQAGAGFVVDRFDYAPGSIGDSSAYPGLLPYRVFAPTVASASSSTDVWMIGNVAWHWDGAGWRIVRLPTVGPLSSLESVQAISRTDAWAVGSSSAASAEIVATHPLLEHWNGNAWSITDLPIRVAAGLESVSADSPGDVWASGWWVPNGVNRHRANAAVRPLIAHWDGDHWHVTLLHGRHPTDFSRVVALAPNDVWATGSSQSPHILVRHWDGTHWQTIQAPFGANDPIRGFTATSANDAWAVGAKQIHGHARTLAAHWDGHTWMIAPTPNQNTDTLLTDTNAISPTDVWAVGESQYTKTTHNPPNCSRPCTEIRSSNPIAIYEHWNGQRWTLAPSSPPQMLFDGTIAITTAHDGTAWAVGGCYFGAVISHWNGHAWHPAPHPPIIRWPANVPHSRRTAPNANCISRTHSNR